MKPSAIYSKSGKGVQEASGKTSLLKRADRAVLSAIDGRATLGEVAHKVGKSFDGAFEQLIAQLDRDGFIREVTAGTSSSQSRPTVPTVKSAAKAPAAKAPASSGGGADDLDFTTIMPAIKPAPRPSPAASTPRQAVAAAQGAKEQESALNKARQEAEAKAQAERDRLRQEAEAKARVEAQAKARADAENRLREEAAAKAKAEIEAQVRAARAKAEAEQLAKLEAERRIREEAERKAREEAEKALREAEALRQRLEEERRSREAEERKRREEEEQRRAREEAERKAREEAERKRREEDERKRREEEERRLREEIEAKAREAAERARREEEDRLLREKEEQVRRAREAEEARMRQALELEEARGRVRQRERDQDEGRRGQGETRTRQPALPAAAAPAGPAKLGDGSLDALMADLDSFSQREEDERRGREAADGKEREKRRAAQEEAAAARAREEAERTVREEAERQRREIEERNRREEEERRAQEEAERRVREVEEQRRREGEERKRKARELAEAAAAAQSDDIGVTDKDLDMDEVRRDESAVAREARKAQRDREREARQRSREAKERARAAAREEPLKYPKARRPVKWGRPVAVTLFVALILAVGALHVVPLPMEQYERAASEALGRPVRIGVGRLSLFTGVRLDLENVAVDGSVRIASVHAYPQIGSLIDEKKAFRRIELRGVAVPQAAIGEVVGARMRGASFKVSRILVTDLKLTGPVPLPTFEADALIGADGAVSSVTLRGPDSLNARLTPAAKGEVEFDVTAASIAVPFAPEVSLASFAMKGTAGRQGMNITSWGGAVFDGVISGSANLRWSGNWQLEGSMTARNINAAVFAPALLSEGKAEGIGRFYMSGADPAKLHNAARIEGSFAVGKGALGTVDLSRALQTSGRQHGGRTQFTEMSGHGIYDRGAVALRNVNISAGALSAGASVDIAPSGALAGRIVADIRTTAQPLRAVVVLGGTVKEPQVRN